ncbi:MAG TPA: 3-dehydroquinate synthase [Coriobacteriia bacterium]|nr:3-dehydroquinate synthase [Coriobacteriia bacterium]
MTATVHVPIPGAEYDVTIGRGLLGSLGGQLRPLTEAARVALVTDSVVASLHASLVDAGLAQADFAVSAMTVPAGESSKSWQMAGDIVEALAAARLDRSDLIVAVGGGVVGDLAGFASAVYLRGIPFVQVPTTLLAMVDSSVGGKTAVDLRAGKNLAGAFKQPLWVLADVATLDTLPVPEWRSGLAEAAKSAVLDGEDFLGWMEARPELGDGPTADTEELVKRCVEFKAGVVGRDEKEEGPRECLNYGHTFGHAIETVAGFGVVAHGAAVAEGMRFAARVAMDRGLTDIEFVKRQDRLLDALGLPPLDIELAPEPLFDAMHSDKKVRGGAVRLVLAESPGVWSCQVVEDAVIRAHLEAWASTKGRDDR